MSYDAVGNMIHQNDLKNGKEKQIAFNSYNRIREVVDPNVGAGQVIGQYWYDDRGFRIRKKAKHDKGGDFKDVEVIYPSMYFGMEYIQEDDELNSVANIYHNGLRIAAMAQNGAKVWYMTDQVDSVKFVVDGNADVVTRTEYMPYGETFVQKGDEDHAPKYNSQELDRETNYYFYNARYYDPEIARFTSADTVIDGEFDTQGWNRFMYVKGNPIGAKDPTGHFEKKDEGFFGYDSGDLWEFTVPAGTVEKGDTFYSIAEQQLQAELQAKNIDKKTLRARIQSIKDINGIDRLVPGQAIITGIPSIKLAEKGSVSVLEETLFAVAATKTIATGGVSLLKQGAKSLFRTIEEKITIRGFMQGTRNANIKRLGLSQLGRKGQVGQTSMNLMKALVNSDRKVKVEIAKKLGGRFVMDLKYHVSKNALEYSTGTLTIGKVNVPDFFSGYFPTPPAASWSWALGVCVQDPGQCVPEKGTFRVPELNDDK